jgi:mRNA-decapping enzyme 1B
MRTGTCTGRSLDNAVRMRPLESDVRVVCPSPHMRWAKANFRLIPSSQLPTPTSDDDSQKATSTRTCMPALACQHSCNSCPFRATFQQFLTSSIITKKMALNINEQARKEANLRLLQRSMDPSISDILGSATHVVLYKFSQSTQSWEKSNFEGGLFLAVRPSGYLLVIVNRNSPDNYPIELSANFQLQHQDPYLIFRQEEKGETVIRGIWFPNADERALVNDLLNKVLAKLRLAPPPAPAPPRAPVPSVSTTPVPTLDHGAAFAALLSPLSLNSNTAAGASPQSTTNIRQQSPSRASNQPMLDKKSLQLALLSLIQDERFIDLLHAQYLKVAHARANRNNP